MRIGGIVMSGPNITVDINGIIVEPLLMDIDADDIDKDNNKVCLLKKGNGAYYYEREDGKRAVVQLASPLDNSKADDIDECCSKGDPRRAMKATKAKYGKPRAAMEAKKAKDGKPKTATNAIKTKDGKVRTATNAMKAKDGKLRTAMKAMKATNGKAMKAPRSTKNTK